MWLKPGKKPLMGLYDNPRLTIPTPTLLFSTASLKGQVVEPSLPLSCVPAQKFWQISLTSVDTRYKCLLGFHQIPNN